MFDKDVCTKFSTVDTGNFLVRHRR